MENSSDSVIPNCLICKNQFDQKPFIVNLDEDYQQSGGEGGREEKMEGLILEQLQRRRKGIEEMTAALGIFTRLLGVGERNKGDGDDELESSVINCSGSGKGSPCCEACCDVLMSIWKVEEVIKQNQAIQLKHVRTLRESLISSLISVDKCASRNENDCCEWIAVRKLLVECVSAGPSNRIKRLFAADKQRKSSHDEDPLVKPKYGRGKRARNNPDGKPDFTLSAGGNEGATAASMKPCSVKLERLNEDLSGKMEVDMDSHPISQDDRVLMSPESTQRWRRVRDKSSIVMHDFSEDEIGLISKRSELKRRSGEKSTTTSNCRSKNTCENIQTFEKDCSGEDFQPTHSTQVGQLPEDEKDPNKVQRKHKAKRRRKQKRDQCPAVHSLNVFTMISDNFLLFKNSPIQYSNEGFTCCDLGCSVTIHGTDYESFQKLKAHIEHSHSDGTKKISGHYCPICSIPMEIATGFEIRSHILNCHRPTYAICEICWKPIYQAASMRTHLWSHKNAQEREDAVAKGEKDLNKRQSEYLKNCELKHVCKTCGMRFKFQAILKRHETTHMARELREDYNKPRKYPWPCHICTRRFQNNDQLQNHLRTHTGEKPFQCEECGKRFSAKYLLNSHAVVHSSEKPYQCEHCALSFKHKRNLRQHQRNVHKELVDKPQLKFSYAQTPAEKRPGFIGPIIAYPCEYCDKVFQLKCRRTKHVRLSHADRV